MFRRISFSPTLRGSGVDWKPIATELGWVGTVYRVALEGSKGAPQ